MSCNFLNQRPENAEKQDKQELNSNVTVDDLLSLSFPLSEAADFMEMGKTFYIPSTQQVCK